MENKYDAAEELALGLDWAVRQIVVDASSRSFVVGDAAENDVAIPGDLLCGRDHLLRTIENIQTLAFWISEYAPMLTKSATSPAPSDVSRALATAACELGHPQCYAHTVLTIPRMICLRTRSVLSMYVEGLTQCNSGDFFAAVLSWVPKQSDETCQRICLELGREFEQLCENNPLEDNSDRIRLEFAFAIGFDKPVVASHGSNGRKPNKKRGRPKVETKGDKISDADYLAEYEDMQREGEVKTPTEYGRLKGRTPRTMRAILTRAKQERRSQTSIQTAKKPAI